MTTTDGPIVITGAGGQLGRALFRALGGLPLIPWTHNEADVADAAVIPRLERIRPRALIHAAAWTDVDGCEADPARAMAVNAEGTRHLAKAAAAVDAHLIYVSTDYVFDGTKGAPYVELDATNPINAYGRSKLAGEAHVRDSCPRHTILRTAWLYGPGGHTFVHTIAQRARRENRFEVVTDQVGSPTLTNDLAEVIRRVLENEVSGVLHAAGEGWCSRYELAQAIVTAVRPGVELLPVRTASGSRSARRPANSSLSIDALRARGMSFRPWRNALAVFLAEHFTSSARPHSHSPES